MNCIGFLYNIFLFFLKKEGQKMQPKTLQVKTTNARNTRKANPIPFVKSNNSKLKIIKNIRKKSKFIGFILLSLIHKIFVYECFLTKQFKNSICKDNLTFKTYVNIIINKKNLACF